MKQNIVGSSLLLVASVVAFGQTKTALSFEVASVKPSPPPVDDRIMRGMGGGPGTPNPGSFTFTNATLKMLIMRAYNLKEYQVEGPEWIKDLGYDIVAKIPAGSTRDQANEMLQTLLKERFKIEFHRESKQLPVMALVVAKGGPKMKKIDADTAQQAAQAAAGNGRGAIADALGPNGRPPALGRMGSGPGIRVMMTPQGREMAGQMTMTQLANALTNQVERAVLDETELTGVFDVDITWMPDEMSGGGGGGRMMMGGGPGGPGPEGGRGAEARAGDPVLTLPQALQEKLGLRLESKKSVAEVFIVDRADQVPAEN